MTKSILGILKEAAGQKDENLFGQAGDEATCPVDDGIFQPDPKWEPKHSKSRTEIMVTGSLRRVGNIRNALNTLQGDLFARVPETEGMEMRVTAFLDGCRHTTPWNNSPVDVGGGTTQWHCHQGQTLFAEALNATVQEDCVDAIIVLGDRFDDKLPEALEHARILNEQGARIFAFHIGGNDESAKAYQQFAEATGGVFLQLTDETNIASIVSIVMDYVLRDQEALQALPEPKTPDAKKLVGQLLKLGYDKK